MLSHEPDHSIINVQKICAFLYRTGNPGGNHTGDPGSFHPGAYSREPAAVYFIEKAKLVLVYCADCLKWYTAFKESGCDPRDPGEGDLLLAVCDAVIAAQNAVVAAESFGIGSCYIGDIMENIEEQRDILGLPPYVFPTAMLVFGYPTEQQLLRQKPERADLKYIVHENGYHTLSSEDLKDMLSFHSGGQDYRSWLKAFCDRKYNSDFSREMTRSVKKYLDDFSTKTI